MSTRAQLLDHLAGVPLFAAGSKGDLKILARHIVEVEVPTGAEVVAEGDRGDAFFVIIEGEASVVVKGARGRKRSVARLGPGGWFGELSVLDPAPRNASVVAKTDMLVGVLGARVFKAMVRDVPALTEKLLAGMARRLRDADRALNDVGRAASSRTLGAARGQRQGQPRRKHQPARSRTRS